MKKELIERIKNIKLLLMDCDGVLTDGRLYFTESGETMKVFHVRDGQGLAMWHKAGFRSGIITGRSSTILMKRTTELGVEFIKQGSINKADCFEDILSDVKLSADQVAYIGDDVQDLVLFEKVGFSVAVADANKVILPYARYITECKGGLGAVREITDLLLKTKEII